MSCRDGSVHHVSSRHHRVPTICIVCRITVKLVSVVAAKVCMVMTLTGNIVSGLRGRLSVGVAVAVATAGVDKSSAEGQVGESMCFNLETI